MSVRAGATTCPWCHTGVTGSGTVGDMNDTTASTIAGTSLPEQRPCTRCDGDQHLVSEFEGMGKYRCDTCEMVVGFDLEASEPEFLISRGLPKRYTKDVFGERLQASERRVTPVGASARQDA